jgi:hypothetical protein
MATTTIKPIYRFYAFDPDLPFRVERREDGSEVLVQPGYAFVNETVPGDRYSLKRSAMQAATDGYREWEALREMHQPMAAGFVPKLEWDDTGAYIEAHVVDPVAQQKVRTGTYKGFSVGVTPTLVNRANEVESCEWVEISLVDRPKDAQAVFTLARVHELDPEEEVEVEVVEEVASSSGVGEVAIVPETLATKTASPVDASSQDASAVPGNSEPTSPTSSKDPSVEDLPSAGPDPPAEGLSHTEAIRQKLREAGLSEELIANVEVVPSSDSTGNLSTERALGAPVVPLGREPENQPTASVEEVDEALGGGMPEGYRVEQAETGLWCAYGGGVKLGEFDTEGEARACIAGAQAAMNSPADRVEVAAQDVPERAMEAEDVPVRENLEPKKKPKSYDEKRSQAEIEGLVYSIGDAFTTLMDSLGSILSSEEHDKHGLISQTVGQYGAHLQEICKSKMGRGELAEEVRLLTAIQPQERAAAAAEPPNAEHPTTNDRYILMRHRDGRLGIRDESTKSIVTQWFDKPEDTEARLTELRAAAVEDTPADAPTVSEIQRLQATNSELTQRLAEHEKVLTRLAASEAEVKRLGSLPLDRENAPVRYAHALDKRYMANLGHEGEAAIAVLRLEYEAAEKEAQAERHGDINKRDRALERMIERASQLAEHGVYLK